MEELIKNIDIILEDKIIKVVISNKVKNSVEYNKITFMLKENNSKEYYQIEKFTDKQVFHENISVSELKDKLTNILKVIISNYLPGQRTVHMI